MKLTIGMAHHTDFDGAYFTIQDIRKELIFNGKGNLLQDIEFLIVENDPNNEHAKTLGRFAKSNLGESTRIVNFDTVEGTSATRNKIIEQATGQFVLVVDCHVLLCPVAKVIENLFTFMEYNKNTNDLYTGPLVYDNGYNISTHYNDEWGAEMWGRWGNAWQCTCERYNFAIIERDKKCKYVSLVEQKEIKKCDFCDRELPQLNYAGHQGKLNSEGYSPLGYNEHSEPFEIFSHGLGLFLIRKNSWLGFNKHAKGFGGEECYIHEKYRQSGRKTICLPFLKWMHRFNRPSDAPYSLLLDNKVRNYILEFNELGLDLTPLKKHFVEEGQLNEQDWNELIQQAETLANDKTNNVDDELELMNEIAELNAKLSNIEQNKTSILMEK